MVKKPLEKDGGEIINKKYKQTIDSEFVLKIKWVNSNANEKTHIFLKKENKVNTAKVKIKIQNKEQQCHWNQLIFFNNIVCNKVQSDYTVRFK